MVQVVGPAVLAVADGIKVHLDAQATPAAKHAVAELDLARLSPR